MYEDLFQTGNETKNEGKRRTQVFDDVVKYQQDNSDSLALDSHDPQTFLMNRELYEKLNAIYFKLTVDTGVIDEKSTDFKFNRRLLKGFRFKFINSALQHFINEYEKQEGKVPSIECVTFSKSNSENHKLYVIEESGTYTVVYHNKYGVEYERYEGLNKKEKDQHINRVLDRVVDFKRKKKIE